MRSADPRPVPAFPQPGRKPSPGRDQRPKKGPNSSQRAFWAFAPAELLIHFSCWPKGPVNTGSDRGGTTYSRSPPMTRAYAQLLALATVVGVRFEDRKDRGATAVEYGLLVGLIAVVIIVAVTALGGQLSTLFNNISGRLPSGAAGGAAG